MGLFGDRFSSLDTQRQANMTPAEAFAGIALITVAADGYFSDEESSGLVNTLMRMHLFRSYPNDVMRRMLDKLLSLLQRHQMQDFLQLAVTSLPYELHETAFAVATDLALADGEITSEEERLLEILYRILDIQEAMAHKIIDVMLIKNKG